MAREINYRRFYQSYGLSLSKDENEMVGECPFCADGGKLFINAQRGVADCKKCGSWNNWSFLKRLVEDSPQTLDELEDNRGITKETLIYAGVCQNFLNDDWLLPSYAYGTDGEIKLLNVYRSHKQKDGKMMLLSGPAPCQQQPYLINLYKKQRTVFICEGHWDTLFWIDCLSHIFPRKGGSLARKGKPDHKQSILKDYGVVGAPGANNWKEEWFKPLKKAETVCLLYDNDEPGQKGVQRMVKKISNQKKWKPEIKVLEWDRDDVGDLRDLKEV